MVFERKGKRGGGGKREKRKKEKKEKKKENINERFYFLYDFSLKTFFILK